MYGSTYVMATVRTLSQWSARLALGSLIAAASGLGGCGDAARDTVATALRFGRPRAVDSNFGPPPALPVAPAPVFPQAAGQMAPGPAPEPSSAAFGAGGYGGLQGGALPPSGNDLIAGGTVEGTTVESPTRPPPDLEQLRGTWALRSPNAGSVGVEVSTCTLVVGHRGVATETCRTTMVLADYQEPLPCGDGRRSWERETTAPYRITIEDGQFVFAPGRARLVRDTSCTPLSDPSHTRMQGSLESPTVLQVVDESRNPSTYERQ